MLILLAIGIGIVLAILAMRSGGSHRDRRWANFFQLSAIAILLVMTS
ncbi:hypothetical protein [Chamaesiphon sp.]